MQLEPGQRIEGEGQAIYQIGDCRARTPWWHLYSGRKVFFNYRYHERELYEAAEDEWLEVQVRAVGGFCGAAEQNVEGLRERPRFEASEVLAKQSIWFPEPLDLIDIAPAEPDGERTLFLIMSDPHGQTLRDWAAASADYLPWKFAVCLELLEVLDSLHRAGTVLGAFGADDFVIDENSRLFCMAADRVVPAHLSGNLRGLYPPARYPLEHAAPEVRSASAAFDARADLYAWASVTVALITTVPPAPEPASDGQPVEESGSPLERMQATLERVAEERSDVLRGLSQRLARSSPSALVSEWIKVIEACLADDPSRRPASVQALQQLAGSRPKKTSVRKLLSQWLGD